MLALLSLGGKCLGYSILAPTSSHKEKNNEKTYITTVLIIVWYKFVIKKKKNLIFNWVSQVFWVGGQAAQGGGGGQDKLLHRLYPDFANSVDPGQLASESE